MSRGISPNGKVGDDNFKHEMSISDWTSPSNQEKMYSSIGASHSFMNGKEEENSMEHYGNFEV